MKATQYCLWLKIVILSLLCSLNIFLFIKSLGINYQHELAREHTRFRQELPTMDSWINSPFGKLKSYLFNVTNAEAFLNGTDERLKLEQVGPIVYYIQGYIDMLERTESSITFRKHRYREVKFLPEESVSADILNRTITLPNMILLGSAAKFNQINSYVRFAFNAVTLHEPIFRTESIYYFLWELSSPGLKAISNVVPFIASNCGTLYNALTEKEEVYKLNIGPQNGIENFFRIDTMNGQNIMKQQESRKRGLSDEELEKCPVNAHGAFDNSLFPPYLKKDTKLEIVAAESCRILPLRYQREQDYDGFRGYRYSLLEEGETPSCLNTTYGIGLPKGMFDVSQCVINEAPSVFSGPHFYGSSYNWSEHYEGLNPNPEEHEPYILIEPTTGIPITEKYRFQSNIPMPNMRGFNRGLTRFSNMMLPTFWYEFDMGELPGIVKFVIHFNVYVTPILQPILMSLYVILALWSALKLVSLLFNCSYGDIFRRLCCCGSGTSNVLLQTTFPQNAETRRDVTPFDGTVK
ncbi:lysosome membrane protein 2 [Scaptodrosophila lebanonensis]|uniref:Lysosome membrane protein 2 n=1 Tax=Drosophila lebanonensis TaxID=7225 RepID=A0A6J2U4Z7_DROLE|nr:lysosome membrane protein 2 [Scaptodrosophila lebanonensis]